MIAHKESGTHASKEEMSNMGWEVGLLVAGEGGDVDLCAGRGVDVHPGRLRLGASNFGCAGLAALCGSKHGM